LLDIARLWGPRILRRRLTERSVKSMPGQSEKTRFMDPMRLTPRCGKLHNFFRTTRSSD